MTLSPKYSHSAIERAYKKELESFNQYCFKYIRYWLLSAFKRDIKVTDATIDESNFNQISPFKESEKALMLKVKVWFIVLEKEREYNMWIPKSVMRNNSVPEWFLNNWIRDNEIERFGRGGYELKIVDSTGKEISSIEVLSEKQEKARAEYQAKKEFLLQKATFERENAVKALKSVGVKGVHNRNKTDRLKELARQNGLEWDEIIKGEGFTIKDLTLNIGDNIEHKIYGKGVITNIVNGNYEVEFNGIKHTFNSANVLKKLNAPLKEFSSDDTFEERFQKIQYNLQIKAEEFVDKNIIKIQKQSENLIDTKFKQNLNVNFELIKANPALLKIQKMKFLENYNLIKSIPSDILQGLQSTLTNAIVSGDQKSILDKLKTLEGISKRRAKTIARDQTAKMLEGVNITRQKNLGIEYYIWETSKDERVSKGQGGHDKLQGRIFRYDKPEAIIDSYGNKGHPSERVNCRCVCLGIIPDIDEKIVRASDNYGYKVIKK